MVNRRQLVQAGLLALPSLAIAPHALAQDKFPSKPLRIIVTFGAGGSGDIAARTLAAQLGEVLGQSVIVENRAGGAAIPGTDYAAKAAPDGYTILQYTGTLAVNMVLRSEVPYDLFRDFVPVHYSFESALVLVTHPTSPIKKFSDLITYAKGKQGGVSYGHGGSGSMGHLSSELLARALKIDAVSVGYKGNGPAMNDLLGGRLDYYFATVSEVAQTVKGGKLTALAVTSAQRDPLLPDVPTTTELGFKEISPVVNWGYMVPKNTPAPIVRQLQDAIGKAINTPAMQERLASLGMTSRNSGGGDVLTAKMKAEIARWEPVIKSAGIKPE